YVTASIFFCGAIMLILEMTAVRMLNPVYGSSIVAWSAVIATTLAAIAAGSFLGGIWADRGAGIARFSHVLFYSALAILLMVASKGYILRLTATWGLQYGVLAASLMLLGPTLASLSVLTTLGIKITTVSLSTLGRRAGGLYAISTLGSVAGALGTGYYLLPHFSVSLLLRGSACLLLVLAGVGYGLQRRLIVTASIASTVLIMLVSLSLAVPTREAGVLFDKESFYGRIQVVDRGPHRLFFINSALQGTIDLEDGDVVESSQRDFELAALLRPASRRALALGLGSGALQRAFSKYHGIAVDVVDIDPVVVEATRSHFGLASQGAVFVDDARTFLRRAPQVYDIILHDAFKGDSQPGHLFTAEFLQGIKGALNPGGVLAINLLSIKEGDGSRAWRSVYKTLASEFAHVRVFAAGDSDPVEDLLFFASDGPLDTAGILSGSHVAFKAELEWMLTRELTARAQDDPLAMVLTDDHCPLDSLNEPVVRAWREWILQTEQGLLSKVRG
ncbi:MAG: fused MFS/spermidine synthase, partial [Elusimicrobiota bacterium]